MTPLLRKPYKSENCEKWNRSARKHRPRQLTSLGHSTREEQTDPRTQRRTARRRAGSGGATLGRRCHFWPI